jgi:cobalt-zinc-cadmium efflux system outer membrane protein
MTADEAVQIALLNNRRLQAVYEDLGVGRAELIQAGLLENPVFEGSLRMDGSDEIFELAVVQDFLSVFTIPLRRARATADLEQAKRRVTAAVVDLAGRTRIAFYRHQAAEQALALMRTMLQSTDASYEAAKRLHEAGNITELALAGERALYEQARIDVSRAEAAVVSARERLNALLGLYGDDTKWRATAELPGLAGELPAPEEIERRAILASLDLGAAKWQVERAGQVLGLARMKSLIPEFGGGVDAERDSDGTWFAGPLIASVIPIFDWGQGSRRKAAAELRRAWREYSALAVEIRAEVRAAHVLARTAQQQAVHYRDVLVPLYERITRETQLQYNAMQLGVFALLAAKQREVLVKRESIAALLDYWTARTRLEQILDGNLVHAAMDRSDGP